ncbi:MAG: 50S ribosomal protein P1 [Candidatus Hydrothermarchaeota archaeon]
MEYIYAAMLLHSAKKEINEDNVKKVLEGAGIEPNDARIKSLVAALEDVDIDKAIESVTTVPTVEIPRPEEKAEVKEKKEEKKKKEEEEKEEEEVAAGLAALFG